MQRHARSTGRAARSSNRGSGKTASLVWRGISSAAETVVAADAQAVVEVIDQIVDDVADSTIMRILGRLSIRTGAVDLRLFYRAGLMVVTDDALTAAAVPEPWIDPASFMWEDAGTHLMSNRNDGTQILKLDIDVRVKRRMPQVSNSLAFIIDNLAGSGTTLDFNLNLKVLLRLP